MPQSDAGPVLELTGIHKQFGGIPALRDVQLRLYPGEIHALMGQNGAGKSTLIKVLTGVLEASGGQMLLAGKPVRPNSPLAAQRLGISTVYQEVNLCPNLSVAENIFAGRYPRCGIVQGYRIDWALLNRRAHELLQLLVFKDFKPLQVANRSLITWRSSVRAPETVRNCRPLISLLAADWRDKQTQENNRNYQLLRHRYHPSPKAGAESTRGSSAFCFVRNLIVSFSTR